METIKPKSLKKGDTIGIISLSGAVKPEQEQNIYKAQKFFEEKGYKTVFSKNIFDKKRYLAGEDEIKAECLKEFFENPEINAILCSRGGYGAIRIINKIDYETIKNNPKIFAGYSDVTAFSLMIQRKTGLITFSAPMACGDFGVDEVSEFSEKHFFETLTNTNVLEIKPEQKEIYHQGQAEGILFGGNLATVVSLCGQDFIPDEKFIFFAEDLNEDVYKIDKMFRQLLNIDKFRKNLSGIVLGEFLDISDENYLNELFSELADELQKPVIGGFKISHAKDKLTIPVGAHANIINCNLKIENYLSE